MCKITVFTPTYNREKTLKRLYQSLKDQKFRNFEWLIVDDGSTDQTERIIKQYIQENRIRIRYYKQPNLGKYLAYNRGLREAHGELFFCVDSDDLLSIDALTQINLLSQNISSPHIAGIIGQKGLKDGTILGSILPNKIVSTYNHLAKQGYKGEWSIIFKTKIATKYPFPIIKEEKFITEAVIYDQIDLTYSYKISNHIFTICEYQEDGLTHHLYPIMLANPGGYKLYYRQRIDLANNLIEKFNYIIRYIAFSKMFKSKRFNYHGKNKWLITFLQPIGLLAFLYYKKHG